MFVLCSRIGPPSAAQPCSRRWMIELSTTWVNRAEANLVPAPPRAAAADTTHSPTRLDAVYTSGEYGRSALPVDAVTTSGTPAASAAATTFRTPSTLVVTVR